MSDSGSRSRLALNYLPVRFEGTFTAGVLPFESSEQLTGLRRRLAETHVVVKLPRTNTIGCVPFVAGAEAIGEPTEFGVDGKDLYLACHVLQAALARTLTSWRFLLSRRPPGPVEFISRHASRDHVPRAAGGSAELDGLHVYPEYKLDVRRNGPRGLPGVIVGLKGRYEIDWTVGQLIERGVHVVGKYVVTSSEHGPDSPYDDPVRQRRLCGRIEDAKGSRLRLQTREGIADVAAEEVWLETSKDNFEEVLAVAAGPSYRDVSEKLAQELFTLTGAEGRMEHTQKFADWLIGLGRLAIADGVDATFDQPVGGVKTAGGGVRSQRLREPTFVFDLGGTSTAPFPEKGLKEFGPYDAESFTPKHPSIVVIAPRAYEGQVGDFIGKFRHGVKGSPRFGQGFVRKYNLTGCSPRFQAVEGSVTDAGAYRRACLAALDGPAAPPHLAIVMVSEQQRHLLGDRSPYLVAKSVLMGQGVPVQVFRLEKMERRDIDSVLNTMAVACYAKLSGTPYVTSVVSRSMAQELVIGIGSAHVQSSRLHRVERFVGITTVFTADGHYRVSNVSREASYDDYPNELLRALRICIEDIKARNGWQPQDTVRLIFHVFKEIKDREAKAIKSLVVGLTTEYADVQFAFVTVSEDHPWMIYDLSAPGESVRGTRKGRYVPARGHAVSISRSEMLITTTGPRELKTPVQGAPHPLLIKLHRESTFTDLDYIAGQVFRFTAMSWRRLYPSRQPVTVMYSDLIAKLLGQLREVSNWNSDIVTSPRLRESRWFL